MITTAFTKLVGCEAPIQLAGMGGMTSPELVAAVMNAGGLGMLAGVQLNVDQLDKAVAEIRSAAPGGKLGINFLMPFLDDACVELAAEKADLVEFFYDTPKADLVEKVHAGGALACWQIGSTDETQRAIDAGCDLIVAQGVEAGGHVRGTTSVLELLESVCSFVKVPVLAAGGVATAEGLAAVIKAGGGGVRVGTRFLVCNESVAHPDYIEGLLKAKASDTVLTLAYSHGWPDAPHRVLQSCIDAAEQLEDDVVGTVMMGDQEVPLPKFNVAPPNTSAKGNVAAMCLYAGESVEKISKRESAADVVHDIVTGAEGLLE